MNDKNYKLIFETAEDMEAVITLTDEQDNEFDAEIIALLQIEDLNREFVAAMPETGTPDFDENEAIILEYTEDEEGEAQFAPLEDDELFETVSQAFTSFFEGDTYNETDDDKPMGYLDDIGDIIPGVSISRE